MTTPPHYFLALGGQFDGDIISDDTATSTDYKFHVLKTRDYSASFYIPVNISDELADSWIMLRLRQNYMPRIRGI